MKKFKKNIPFGYPLIDKKERNEINNVLNGHIYAHGPRTKKFEEEFCKYTKAPHSISVSSCTAGMHLVYKNLNISNGDEVIVPAQTHVATAHAVEHAGAKPVFVDCDPKTGNIDPNKIEKKITKKTKAILVPNLIGNIPDLKRISHIAKKYKIKVIEDSADTLGAKIGKFSTGYFSDISITSFYGSHVISCAGNGGMFMTNNKKIFEKAKILRSWGRMSSLLKASENIKKRLNIKLKGFNYDKKFVFSEVGYNFEPSEIGASFGLVQLKKFKKFSKIRKINFNKHILFFKKYPNLFITPRLIQNVNTNFLAYPIIIKKNKYFDRKKLQIHLEKNNVQTRPIFSGNLLRHPAFEGIISKRNSLNSFKNSDYIMKNGILVGCHQGLSLKNIEYIHYKILKLISKKK